jgi:RNA polymerase sigma factor (sigma-70 family)
VLGHAHAAEDAFQATFLALARHARGFRRPTALPAWLHAVAVRTARHARAGRQRRRRIEALAPPAGVPTDPLAEVSGRELVAVINDELARLPEQYRLPLLLCGLEGLARDEAAARLGWNLGTLRGRLERGRELLRKRLATRGLTRLDVATAHNGIQNGLAIAPDGTALAVVHRDKEIQVRDLPDGSLRVAFPLPDSARYKIRHDNKDYFEYRVGFSAGGRTLLRGTVGGAIHRWNLAAKTELPALKTPLLPRVQANNMSGFHILPGGQTLASTGADGLIRTWDLRTARERIEPEAYVGWVHAATSPGGRLVAVADERGRVDLWDAATGKLARTVRRDGPAVANLAFAPDGRSLAAGQWTGTVQFWAVPSGREGKTLRGEGGDVWTPASTLLFSPDGQCLYINDYLRRAQLWDIATGAPRWRVRHDYGAAFAPDGGTLIASRDGPSMAFVDAATGAERRTVRLNSEQSDRLGTFRPVAVAPDGRLVAAALMEGIVTLCDAQTGAEVRRFTAVDPIKGDHPAIQRLEATHHITVLAFAPSGYWLATGGSDMAVRIWDVLTGQEVLRFDGHEGKPKVVAFGSDGRTVLTAGEDGRVYSWSLQPRPAATAGTAPDALWADLAGANAAKAYQALWALSREPWAAGFLRERIPPAAPPDADRVAKLVTDLDSDQFRVRAAAAKELAEQGAPVIPILEKELRPPLSPEARQRVRGVLDTLKRGPTAVELRQLRAVQALELAGTAEARAVLRAWAGGAAGAELTRAAADALKQSER